MDQVEYLLRQRGFDFQDGSDNVLVVCPFHDDTNPSLSVHRTKGVFHCFSCAESGNFTKLIAEIDGVSYEEATDIIDLGFNPQDSLAELSNLVAKADDKVRFVNEDYFFSTFTEVKGIFKKYLQRRQIGDRAITRFQIRCCYEGKYRNRVVIPIRDYENRMVSFTARSIFSGTKPKTMKLKSSKITNNSLFGLREMPDSNNIVLVEGEMDCIYLQQFLIPAVSLMGKLLTDKRIEMILDNFSYVYISYDNDKWGNIAARKHLQILKDQMPASRIILPKGCDPNDLSLDDVLRIYGEVIPEKVHNQIQRQKDQS